MATSGLPSESLLEEGIRLVVEKKVSAIVDEITQEIIGERIESLKDQIAVEVKAQVESCKGSWSDKVDAFITIETKKKD